MRAKRFDRFGGAYIAETLVRPVDELRAFWQNRPKEFDTQYKTLLERFAGRPTPLTEVRNFAKAIGSGTILLKREDLLHTGAHKINNCIGQCLIAKQMGKNRVIAETGAGQHGVATASACAHLGIECVVYMGKVDAERQEPNVKRMRLMGATVILVDQGSAALKDAINEAMRDWSQSYDTTHYCLGSVLGPDPYPDMVGTLQSVIGEEVKSEIKHPNTLIACVGGGSNAIGFFRPFLGCKSVKMIGVEGGGTGKKLGEHASRFQGGKEGIFHGCLTEVLQTEHGQIATTHSISAGLDYPAIGPEHAALHHAGRIMYSSCTDAKALEALELLSKTEGIIPALESAHALGYLIDNPPKGNDVTIVNLSGRGDKDLPTLFETHPELISGEMHVVN